MADQGSPNQPRAPGRAVAASAPKLGSQVAHYRIIQKLGEGGMGIVYKAEDVYLNRPVALKMIRSNNTGDEMFQRFVREARAVAAVKHPHIVTIFHVGEEGDWPFIAMEFLEGESLGQRIERVGRLPVGEVCRIGREIAEGLAAAHQKGIIHRDIKPANIWLEAPNGSVKILDFGLARDVRDSTAITKSGYILGTPDYMAPEQAAGGQPLDARCDLFSLGCVLYQLASGDKAFKGESTFAVLTSLAVSNPRPLTLVDPQLPAAFSDLIMALLAKKPEDRPQTAREVVAALDGISARARTRQVGATYAPPPNPSTNVGGNPEKTVGLEIDNSKTTAPSRFGRRWLLLAIAVATCVALGLLVIVPLSLFLLFRNKGETPIALAGTTDKQGSEPAAKLPAANTVPRLIARLTSSGEARFHATAMRFPYVYALDGAANLRVFKLPETDPDSPIEIRDRLTVPRLGDGGSVLLVGDVLLSTQFGGLEIYSVKDPANPRRMGGIAGNAPSNTSSIVHHGKNVFLIGAGFVTAYDISEPSSPNLLGMIRPNSFCTSGIAVGNRLYVGEFKLDGYPFRKRNGFAVYDISNPAAPSEKGFIATKFGPYGFQSVEGGRFVALLDPEVQLFSLADPDNPSPLGPPQPASARSGIVVSNSARQFLVTPNKVFAIEKDTFRAVPSDVLGMTNDGVPHQASRDGDRIAIPCTDLILVFRLK